MNPATDLNTDTRNLKWLVLGISCCFLLTACGDQASLSKSDYKLAAATDYDYVAVLELKNAVGGPVAPYIHEPGQASPQPVMGLLDEQGGDWHPAGKRILGLYANLKPGITNDQAKSIAEKLRCDLPEGYTASFFDSTSRSDDNVFHSIIVQKICGRQCSAEFAPFQEQAWKSGRNRMPMAESLVHRQALIGLSSKKLFSLLGRGSEMVIAPSAGSGGFRIVYDYSMKSDHGKEHGLKPDCLKVLAINDRVAS